VLRPEESHDGMVDVVTRGGGISKGGPARNFSLEHWPWEREGAGVSSQDLRKSIDTVITKRLEGELGGGLQHQSRWGALSEENRRPLHI
jgi:hypothetical protein